jgi:hypothetical protein
LAHGTIEIKIAAMPLFAEEQVVTLSPAPEILTTIENPLISNEKFRNLYLAMARLRHEAQGFSHDFRQPRRRLALDEAGVVGCTVDLSPEDTVMRLADQSRQVSTSHLLQNTNASARNIIFLQSSASLALATGAAFLQATQGKGRIVLAFAKPKQMAGSRETLRFAYQNQLPVIYVQLDASQNGSKTGKPRTSSTIPSIPVDRADVVAVYRVASEAIDKARRGAGPTIIECMDYRLAGVNKRSQSRDPLIYMEALLRKKNLWSEDLQTQAKVKPPSTARI